MVGVLRFSCSEGALLKSSGRRIYDMEKAQSDKAVKIATEVREATRCLLINGVKPDPSIFYRFAEPRLYTYDLTEHRLQILEKVGCSRPQFAMSCSHV